jgi:hypothetical protein
VALGNARDGASQAHQLGTGLGRSPAYAGPDLDLALQEFGRDLAPHLGLALGQQTLGRLPDQGSGARVDQEVLLLDTQGEGRLLDQRVTTPSGPSSLTKRSRICSVSFSAER